MVVVDDFIFVSNYQIYRLRVFLIIQCIFY